MSSILKALKRLEEEQAGRAAPSGGQFVALPRSGRTEKWRLLAVGIGVGLLLAAGGYLLLTGRQNPPPQAVATPVGSAPASGVASPIVQTTVSAPQPKAVVKAVPMVAGAGEPAEVTAVAPRPAPPSREVPAPVAAVPRPPVAPVVSPITSVPLVVKVTPVEQVQVERREIPAPGTQWAAPHLVVSEILPDTGGGRMAIVNGLPVMEGTMVEDAVVKAIDADKVVFVVDGKTVAVPLAARP